MKSQDNPNRTEPWTITQLQTELRNDLAQCTSKFERDNAEAMTRIQMRELRDKIKESGRKFTPGECAVMDSHGINY